jgi:hypothetical protein
MVLATLLLPAHTQGPHQQCSIDRLLAQVEDEFLQGHGLIVDADDHMAQLRQEELNLVVAEASQLGAEDVGDADMVSIPPAIATLAPCAQGNRQARTGQLVREIGHREEGILIEDIALDEPVQQIPRHWDRLLKR